MRSRRTRALRVAVAAALLLGIAPATAARAAVAPLKACKGSPGFQVEPLQIDDLVSIRPLGNVNPTAHVLPTDHLYFMLPGSNQGRFGSVVPVAAPGKVMLTDVFTSQSSGPTEYALTFSPCTSIHVYYGHTAGPLASSISSALRTARKSCNSYTTGGSRYRTCNYTGLKVWLSMGQRIAYTSGLAAALDVGAYDDRVHLSFANTARHSPQSRSTICPIDLFAEFPRRHMQSRLGDGLVARTAVPVCGRIDQDVRGTAQGDWFPSSQATTQLLEDNDIALVHDNFDPAVPVLSVGNGVAGLASGRYTFTPRADGTVNRDFRDVRPSQVYCYESLTNTTGGSLEPVSARVLVRMPTSTTLSIAGQSGQECGAGPWSMPTRVSAFKR